MPLSKYKDLHAGQTAVIVGNGPSLNDVHPNFLRRYITFGTNRIFLHPCFVPHYYVAVDPTVVREDFVRKVSLLPSTKFLSEKFSKLIPGAITIRTTTEKYFFKDNLFWEGWSVTFVALQLAYMMGFTTVLLVGVDHRYKQGQKNHFHHDYEDGMYWVKHDMTLSIPAYEMAKEVYEADGRIIINMTPGSDLKVFPMQDWI